MKRVVIFCLVFLVGLVSCDNKLKKLFLGWDDFNRFMGQQPEGSRASFVDDFLEQYKGAFPIVDNKKAVFVYRGDGKKLFVAGDFNGWKPKAKMKNIVGTKLWWYSFNLPAESRLEYKMVKDGQWILDSLNPRLAQGGFGNNSDLWMKNYKEPTWIAEKFQVKKGKLSSFSIQSKELKIEINYKVYTPVGYDSSKKYSLILFHDGSDYLKFGKISLLLDILISKKLIKPLVAIFVDPKKRNELYGCNDYYWKFTANKLVPAVEKKFSISKESSDRCFAGASMGGIVSFHLLYRMRSSFGAAIMQSGAFLYDGMSSKEPYVKPVNRFLKSVDYKKLKGKKIWIDCGTIGDLEKMLLTGNSILRRKLARAGVAFKYMEVAESHNWASWRKRMELAILEIFGVK